MEFWKLIPTDLRIGGMSAIVCVPSRLLVVNHRLFDREIIVVACDRCFNSQDGVYLLKRQQRLRGRVNHERLLPRLRVSSVRLLLLL